MSLLGTDGYAPALEEKAQGKHKREHSYQTENRHRDCLDGAHPTPNKDLS